MSGRTPVAVIGVGVGRAHLRGYLACPDAEVVALCDVDKERLNAVADEYGIPLRYTDYRELLKLQDLAAVSVALPNYLHAPVSIAAMEAGKHVLCEKPLARNAQEAKAMFDAAHKAGVKHMVAHNYRFVPAIRQAYNLIQSGKLGRIYHFRAMYLQEWIMPHYGTGMIWRLDKQEAGSGALGDLGAHIIDLARFLVGEMKSLSAMTKTFIPQRPNPDGTMGKVEVDDAFAAVMEFENGAIGTLECSRFAAGRKNYNCLEINGEYGSIQFNLERMNELEVFWIDDQPKETQGFHNVIVTEGYHPWISNWWPHGHIIGWEHTFIHEIHHLLDCIVNNKDVAPFGATFEDGYRNAVVCDAIVESAATRRQVDLKY